MLIFSAAVMEGGKTNNNVNEACKNVSSSQCQEDHWNERHLDSFVNDDGAKPSLLHTETETEHNKTSRWLEENFGSQSNNKLQEVKNVLAREDEPVVLTQLVENGTEHSQVIANPAEQQPIQPELPQLHSERETEIFCTYCFVHSLPRSSL